MRQLTDKAAPSTAAPHDCPMRPRVAAHRQGRAFNGCAPQLSEAPLCGCSQKRPRLLMAAPLDRPMRPWLAAHGHGRASNGCASHTTNAPLVRLPRDTAAPLMVAPQKSPSAPPVRLLTTHTLGCAFTAAPLQSDDESATLRVPGMARVFTRVTCTSTCVSSRVCVCVCIYVCVCVCVCVP